MNRTMLAIAAVLSASSLLIVDSAVKGTVLLALAAVAALILRRDSAATRHLVWLLAIVALLVVPLLSAMLPQWRVLPAWASQSPNLAVVDVRPSEIARPADVSVEWQQPSARPEIGPSISIVDQPAAPMSESQDATVTPKINSGSTEGRWNWIHALPLVWAAGFSVLILRLTAARWMLWNSERRATVVSRRVAPHPAPESRFDSATAEDPVVMAMAGLCSQLGISRPVTLLIHPEKTIPLVWGILHCRLMLPAAARLWSDEQLRSVLLHELAHIKRRDTLVQLLVQVACALHWFNPLVWFAAWRLDVERERSCDDLVLASGVRPSAYAGHLLDVVSGLSPARWTQSCGLAMARSSSLEGRLTAVLGKDLNRRSVSVALAGLALAVAVGAAVPIAMLRAADEWNPPHGAHIGSNEFSAFCVHDGQDATFVIAYQGDFDSTSRSSSNARAGTWTDSVTLTAKQPGIALSLHRTHIAPDQLSITTAPAEGRALSNPAPPPREFGQKEYDLAKGRVFLLGDNGSVRQLDIATPMVRDKVSAARLAALIAANPPQERNDSAVMTNFSVQLPPETIAKLKWGEPVNGLRMALAYPPALGDALLGNKPHFELVVQNIAEEEIHFLASDAAPNPRRMLIREEERIVLGLSDPEVSAADWKLQPGQCGVLRLYTNEERDKAGTIPSAGLESDLSKLGRYHAIVQMEIAKAPPGAWTGQLITGKTRGSADVVSGPVPMHKDAQATYEVWQRHARVNGDIPGALVGELAAAVKTFIRYNPTWETVPKLNAILPRLDASHDWKPADAIALLDEVAGIQDSPLKPAPWKGTRHTIRQGEPLPKTFADVTWGETHPNGLHAAWVLEPIAAEHRIGAALKARLLVHNAGQVPVMLQVPTFHQGWVKARDAKDAEVEVSGISWTTLALLVPVRLAPGESIQINTPGVGIGPRAGMGPWAGPRVGSNVLAKPGDELTLTHGLVPLDGSGVGVSEDDPHVIGPGWWLAHIKARLSRELPLPADAAERTRLLDRAVHDLFATAPTEEEIAAFVADQTPDALDALATRLAARVDVVSFSGTLPTAPAKFRALAADPAADKIPRVVLGPGEYPLSAGTAGRGAATLKIVGRPVGDRSTNEAQILFEATEATGKLPPDPHKLEVPDGRGTWAIVCRPGKGFFYLLHKGGVRKIDYSDPAKVTDTPADDLPAEFRDEVKRILDIHEISAAQTAEIFEKPDPPAEMPRPKSAAVTLTPESLIGTWRGTLNDERLLLSFHRPPVENEIHADLYVGDATIGMILEFTIDPDGRAVTLTRGNDGEFGRLTPSAEGVCQLELSGRQKGQREITITRDNELAATEPGQKEPRELFAMWKATANTDGTIPGTFIGQLAAEVRAYVKAHPTLDSAAKLPKLLPRFVTSRAWTQAEAIQLLDDVAYYATEPIAARVAKAKLPSSPLWRTEVEFEDIPVQIAKWSEVKDGLRIGMRIVEPVWHIGGKTRVELWLHNAGGKDAAFKSTGPNRQDVGVAVSAIDEHGQEHWAENGNVAIIAGPLHCMLPAGHVAMAKALEITFAAPHNDEKAWIAPRFRDLKPGKYQLRCKWMDAHPTLSKAGDWTGELTAPDLEFTLAAAVAAPPASETPKTTEKKPFTAWGEEVNGVQIGVQLGEQRIYEVGESVTLIVRLRNNGKGQVPYRYGDEYFLKNPPLITDASGKAVTIKAMSVFGTVRLESVAPGQEVDLVQLKLDVRPVTDRSNDAAWTIYGTGKFRIQYPVAEVVGEARLDLPGMNLTTGKLELEVRPDAPVQAASKPKQGALLKPATVQKLKWGEPVNGLRMALAWPPTLGEPGLGDVPEFYLVVQNVLDKGVRLTANDAAPNPRMLDLYDTTIVSRSVDDVTIPGDWLLQPRETAFVRLFHAEQKFEDGRTTSVLKENVVSTLGQYSYTAEMSIGKAPAGAWTGKLVTGATRGSADVLEAGKPIELRSAPPMSWGVPKDGLRGAFRIIGEMRTGGQAKAELWVWNASTDVVKLSWTERADIGLAVMMADGTNPAREAPVTRDKKDFQLHYLVLPAGQAVKLKEFAVRLGSPPNDAPVGTVSLPLTPGEWTLQARWSDSRHIIDAAPEWHGTLDTGELKLKVTPEGATVAEAAAVKAKWPPVRQKTEWSEEFLAHSKAVAEARGTPEATPEDLIAWGVEENGLRAGLLMAPQITLGGQLPTRMVLRNVSNDVRELGLSLSLNRLTATAQTPDGNSLQVHKTQLRGGDALYKVTLFPGEQVEFEGPPVQFGVEHDGETKKVKTPKFPICGVETGVAKVHVRFTVQASTGVAVVEVTAAKAGAAHPQAKGAINAEAALVRREGKGKDADGKPVVLMLFEELQREEATSTVRVKSIGGGGGSVGSPMFIIRGACEIAKARGAAYFANLKEWEGEDGTWMYLIGFSKKQDIRPLTSDRQLQIFAVGQFDFLFKDPAAADADKPQEKLAELDAKIAALKMERVRLSESLAPTHANIRKLDAEVETLEKARTAFVATNRQANADSNIDKVPDDQYVKSGFPVEDLAGEGVMWNDEQNGLSLGYRITGDEWRILGKEVKVELWVQNPGDKDVKFQDNMRADPEFGLRVKLKDAKGEDHNSNFWPDDRPPFGFHRLLPPGHALKVKEFTVSLFLPENDFSHAKGHFFGIDPGAYHLQCELELPGFSATGEGGKPLTPAAGEWTGKLTTRGFNVEVIAPDAPAPKPRIESVVVGISKDGEVSLDRKKMPLDELKTRAARNAKKWFTIDADEDVPYAKVIAVIEALKASGVTQFSFAKARVGDGKYRVANRTGSYEFDETRRFSICQPFERKQWFTVGWPAKDGQPAKSLRLFPNAGEQTRGTWAVVWEPGTDVLWWVDDTDIGRMTLTDPARIIVQRKGRKTGFSRDFAVPDGVATEFRRLGFEVGGKPGEPLVIGGPTSTQEILSAEPVQKPTTDSTFRKSTDPDDSAPPVQPQAEQGDEQPIKS